MNRKVTWVRRVLLCAALAFQSPQLGAQIARRTTYTLLGDSSLLDQCLICGRPDIYLPLRGTFDLVLAQDSGTYRRYDVTNLAFVAGEGTTFERRLTGEGTYFRFEEFAVLQDMTLALDVRDRYTNRSAYFTNTSRLVEKRFPLIQVSLKQTNGTLLQTFTLDLLAAPMREIWFSTAKGFTSTNRPAPENLISAGDLLSNRGRVIKRNRELVYRLGVMPVVPDLGLDAVQVTRRGEIFYSIPGNVFSESLGPIQHGDLLSNRGAIVKRNQDLLAAFHPPSTVDAGLDGVQVMPDGEILFSIRSNVVASPALTLSRGDILSDRGKVFVANERLMANFQPTVNRDFGLDAFWIQPGPDGEIWFSVDEGFTDNRLGVVQAGDLLSNLGYRVFRNQDLVAAFAPQDPAQDYGLDALFVVTDTLPIRNPPRITRQTCSGRGTHLEWDGEGSVFQVERADNLSGPWTPISEILPDLSWDSDGGLMTNGSGFFRLRQW